MTHLTTSPNQGTPRQNRTGWTWTCQAKLGQAGHGQTGTNQGNPGMFNRRRGEGSETPQKCTIKLDLQRVTIQGLPIYTA